ncbi:putative MFS drug efflux pump [Cryphonectria parasitica EP155]|uniref:MFS drug efflux pump n=1 Tax=Cryphonectria parasitica (strain ATCC 38755 / EP155) TaxID=660469 RepID=A0A9P4Y9X5_CRYP1|nr:putative MFS drug efflux pump [Cryphonectria parasitica EP155]KAF3769471.1 putative MFS drug efflux pump [Cryphonectria parasitica EP155]
MSSIQHSSPDGVRESSLHGSDIEKRASSEKPVHENIERLSTRALLAFVALSFLWTGSQIPIYLFGAIPPYIYADIGGADRWTWITLANILALAAVCPFVGSLSDLFGRRYIALSGATFILVGMIVCSTAKTMNIVIGGQVLAGIGAGINELTALAAASEMAPVSKRGKYVGVLVFTITPFCLSALYAQLIAAYSSWRYVGLLCALWNLVGLVMTALFYFPPPRTNPNGLSRREILGQIDFVGGFLSVSGLILFMAGMQWGGYTYPWTSPHVLVPLLLGAVLVIMFIIWEGWFAKNPMFPKRINENPRVLVLTLIITCISGANFISLIAFWPTQAFNVYGHDPVQVGIRAIPIGLSLMTGAVIGLFLLSIFKGANRTIMIVSSVCMTAGCGAMAIGRVDNMYQLWGILVLAGLGIGGIVVPASIITMIVCPDDLIATVAALTLSIRVIGGSIGYSIYYNIFINKFVPYATEYIGGTLFQAGITSTAVITEVIELTGAALPAEIALIPGIAGNTTLYNEVIYAGQVAYAASYRYVYLASIAFGCISIVCSLFLGDIGAYMDDHVAVHM